MSKTYSQVILQIVFTVKYRHRRIHPNWKDGLHSFIAGIINKNRHRCLIVNSVPDHIHILISMNPHQAVSDLVREIKNVSGIWINSRLMEQHPYHEKFRWQEGFGVFSYNISQKNNVYQYVLNQEHHHNQTALREEFQQLMLDNELDFDPRYAGEWLMEDDAAR